MLVMCFVIGIFSAVVAEAATYGYLTKETVTKNGTATVHSNGTGTNTFAFNYGATRTAGKLTVEVQRFSDGDYLTVDPITRELDDTEASFSDTGLLTGYRIFRIQLSGLTGRGSGWIQGRS